MSQNPGECGKFLKIESTKLTLKCVCHTKVSIISYNNNKNTNNSIEACCLLYFEYTHTHRIVQIRVHLKLFVVAVKLYRHLASNNSSRAEKLKYFKFSGRVMYVSGSANSK